MEEFQKASELAWQIMEDYVHYNKDMQEVTITYGALEEQVGLWLVDIINNKLIWRKIQTDWLTLKQIKNTN